MPRPALMLLLLLVSVVNPLTAAELAPDALDALYAKPPATGLLILRMNDDGQAAALGLLPGDILVSYDGQALTTSDGLRALTSAHHGRSGLELIAMRGEQRVTVKAVGAPLGVFLAEVQRGVDSGKRARRAVPLPAATGARLDLTRLPGKPIDAWHEFHFTATKVGFEHFTLSMVGDRLHCSECFAFTLESAGGLVHSRTVAEATTEAQPRLLSAHGVGDAGSTTDVQVLDGPDGLFLVHTSTAPQADTAPPRTTTTRLIAPRDLIDLNLLFPLATCMPRTLGACVHFSVFDERQGAILPIALLVERHEALELADGARVDAWAVRLHGTRGPGWTTWVDDGGRILKNDFGPDYGGAWSTLSTKDAALAGLDATVAACADP